jgi:hypothetical protein
MGGTNARTLASRLAILCSIAVTAACSGDGSASSTSVPTGATNDTGATSVATSAGSGTQASAASLTGNAAGNAIVGVPYEFRPIVSGGTASAFSASNLPKWATFDVTTGAIAGTPTAGDVGTNADISITAVIGTTSVALTPFTIVVAANDPVAAAAPSAKTVTSATLTWLPPTENTDGSTLSNLAGYRIYYGTDGATASNTIDVTNPGLTAYTVSELTAGTYHFAIAALNTDGIEGQHAAIGSITVM